MMNMRKENIWLVVFGIILLLIGLGASLYVEVKTIKDPFYGYTFEVSRTYPYQGVGIFLTVTGIILSSIGIFISLLLQRSEQ